VRCTSKAASAFQSGRAAGVTAALFIACSCEWSRTSQSGSGRSYHFTGLMSRPEKSRTSQSNQTCRYKSVFSGRVQKYYHCRVDSTCILTSSNHFSADPNSLGAMCAPRGRAYLTDRFEAECSCGREKFRWPWPTHWVRSSSFRFVRLLRQVGHSRG